MQYVACLRVGQNDVKALINLEDVRRDVVVPLLDMRGDQSLASDLTSPLADPDRPNADTYFSAVETEADFFNRIGQKLPVVLVVSLLFLQPAPIEMRKLLPYPVDKDMHLRS